MGSLIVSTLPEKAIQPQQFGDVVAFKRPVVRATYPAADFDQLEKFTSIIFGHCRDVTGWIAIRGFPHSGDGRPVLNEWFPLGRGLVQEAAKGVTQIANRTGEQAAVFAPPVAVFGDMELTRDDGSIYRPASAANVVCAPAIAVELDQRPSASLAALVAILGRPTVVVRSGGIWQGPDGTIEDRLHAYWRLASPAVTADDQALLRRARDAATRLVGGDPTAVSLAHPMRWPGSWHTKTDTPRLCEIIVGDLGGDPQLDVDLQGVLVSLEAVLVTKGLDVDTRRRGALGERKGFKTETEWSADELLEAARLLPNDGRDWDDWNKWGMTFFDASHNSVDGLEAFHAWSEKDPRYDPDACDARWSHWHSSPPSNLSAGSLVREIRKTHPDYRKPPKPEPEAFFDETPGPLDIFGEADPAELGRVPAGALPPLLERWVRSEARRKGVQPSFPALCAVIVLASSIGASLKIAVRQHDDWTEPAGLWGALIAPPGSTKTPAISAGAEPLRKLDGEWLRADGPIHAEWLKQSRKKQKADAPPLGPEPRRRRAVVDDVTFERLTGIFADNPNGLLRDTDELSGVFGSLGAYKAGSDGDRSQLLRMFDGGSISRDRQTAGSSYAETALLSILAGSQPEKIRKMVDGLGTDGMLQRFLFVMHDGIERKGIDEEKDVAASQAYNRIVRGLKTAEYLYPAPLRMTPEAIVAFNAVAERLSALRHMLGAGPAFQDHVSKWGKFLPRLVLIFHAVEEFDRFGAVDPAKPIDVAIVEMAGRFARFLMLHSIRFYAEFFGTPDTMSEARSIAGYLLTRPDLQEITRRGVSDARTSLRGEGNLRALLGAMAELEASGWCEVNDTKDGKPSRWKIDQRIHVRYAARAVREKEERGARHARIVQAGQERKRLNEEHTTDADAPVRAPTAFD